MARASLLLSLLAVAKAAQMGGIPPPITYDVSGVPGISGVGYNSIANLAGVGASGLSAPLASQLVNPYNSYAAYPQSIPNIFVIQQPQHAKDRGPGWLRCPNFGLKVSSVSEIRSLIDWFIDQFLADTPSPIPRSSSER